VERNDGRSPISPLLSPGRETISERAPSGLPCPQGKFAGILSRIPRDQVIHVQFYAVPQRLEEILCVAGAGNRAGKPPGKLASLIGNFTDGREFRHSAQRGEFFTRSFAGDDRACAILRRLAPSSLPGQRHMTPAQCRTARALIDWKEDRADQNSCRSAPYCRPISRVAAIVWARFAPPATVICRERTRRKFQMSKYG
jgi:hypothetical protein